MNKSFENEYRQMMKQEAPDLWDRISSSLPPQNIKRVSFRKYAGAIAACICAAVLIPAVLAGTGKKRTMQNAAYEAAAVASEAVSFDKMVSFAETAADEEKAESVPETEAEESTRTEGPAADASGEAVSVKKKALSQKAKERYFAAKQAGDREK